MFRFKKLFIILFIILFMLIMYFKNDTPSLYIKESKTSSKYINKLLQEKGIPLKLINVMPLNLKNDIIKNTGDFINPSQTLSENGMDKVISNEKLDLYVMVFHEPKITNKNCKYYIYSFFKWKEGNIPLFLNKDILLIRWENEWSPVPKSQYHENQILYKNNSKDIFKYDSCAYLNPIVVGWNININSLSVKSKTNLTGFGRSLIEHNNCKKSKTTKISTAYICNSVFPKDFKILLDNSSINMDKSLPFKKVSLILNLN